MLVQQYLKTKTLADLEAELGIEAKNHPSLPLTIFNYSQLNSPKNHDLVRECRGLVLDNRDWSLVSKSMHRFFNWGEVVEEQSLFDFKNFIVQEKLDGSLAILYNFEGKWHANTRNSFALDKIEHQSFTWREAFCKAMNVASLESLSLNPDFTYICEFVSPWNKVVRYYPEPKMYLLTIFHKTTELHWDEIPDYPYFLRPACYEFHAIDEIRSFLEQQSEQDPTFEGVIIRDSQNHRHKLKSLTYLSLHALRDGNNLFNPKYLLPFILNGEEAELLLYFEEIKPAFYELKSRVLEAYIDLLELWADEGKIADQKEFALKIKEHPFASIMFEARKKLGFEQKSRHIKELWRQKPDLILKRLF